MATATTKGRSNRGATSVSMELLIMKDNGGHFHWTLLDRDGYSLGRSPSSRGTSTRRLRASRARRCRFGAAGPPRGNQWLARHPGDEPSDHRREG